MDHVPSQKHYQTQDESFSQPKIIRGGRSRHKEIKDKRGSQSRSPAPHSHMEKPKTPSVLKRESIGSTRCDGCFEKKRRSNSRDKRDNSRFSGKEDSPASYRESRKKGRSKPRPA